MLNGHFSEVQKRGKANEANKKQLRDKINKNRKSYIGYKNNTKLEFPKFTDEEFKNFKKEVKRNKKIKQLLTLTILILIIIVSILITNYILF